MSTQKKSSGDIRKRSAATSTIIVMAALVLSKITGQLREMLIPSRIGFGMLSDAFILGFLIPDLFYQLLVGGSIQAAVTPTIAGAISEKKEKDVWRSVSVFINITASVMLLAVVAGELLIPYILPLFSGDKSAQAVDLAASVSRWLFPQVFFMMLAALSIGVLNAYKKFTIAAMGPVVYNICVVASMLIFGNRTAEGVRNTALGILVSAAVYFMMQFMSARRQFRHYVFSFDINDSGFRRLVRLAVPTLISASIVQINLIILSGFMNLFDDGSLTSMRFATTTWQLPYGVVAVAIGSVMLPTLSGHFAVKKNREFSRVLTRSLRSALFLIIPSAVIFAFLSKDVIRGIFEWGSGALTESAVALTAEMLVWYCIAMFCHTIIYLMNMSFYAAGKTTVPLLNGAVTLVTNTAFCFVFTNFTSLGAVGMPMAYAFSSIISSLMLYLIFLKTYRRFAPRKIPQYLVKSAFCAGSCFLVLWLTSLIGWSPDSKILQLLDLAAKSAVGMVGYFLASMLLQMREPADFTAKIRKRLGFDRS